MVVHIFSSSSMYTSFKTCTSGKRDLEVMNRRVVTYDYSVIECASVDTCLCVS